MNASKQGHEYPPSSATKEDLLKPEIALVFFKRYTVVQQA
jgi:hypothetical protein